MYDNVCAVVDWVDQVTARAKCVINNEGYTSIVSDLGNGLEVRNVVFRVTDAFNVKSLGVFVNKGGKFIRVVTTDKLDLDAEAW